MPFNIFRRNKEPELGGLSPENYFAVLSSRSRKPESKINPLEVIKKRYEMQGQEVPGILTEPHLATRTYLKEHSVDPNAGLDFIRKEIPNGFLAQYIPQQGLIRPRIEMKPSVRNAGEFSRLLSHESRHHLYAKNQKSRPTINDWEITSKNPEIKKFIKYASDEDELRVRVGEMKSELGSKTPFDAISNIIGLGKRSTSKNTDELRTIYHGTNKSGKEKLLKAIIKAFKDPLVVEDRSVGRG